MLCQSDPCKSEWDQSPGILAHKAGSLPVCKLWRRPGVARRRMELSDVPLNGKGVVFERCCLIGHWTGVGGSDGASRLGGNGAVGMDGRRMEIPLICCEPGAWGRDASYSIAVPAWPYPPLPTPCSFFNFPFVLLAALTTGQSLALHLGDSFPSDGNA